MNFALSDHSQEGALVTAFSASLNTPIGAKIRNAIKLLTLYIPVFYQPISLFTTWSQLRSCRYLIIANFPENCLIWGFTFNQKAFKYKSNCHNKQKDTHLHSNFLFLLFLYFFSPIIVSFSEHVDQQSKSCFAARGRPLYTQLPKN